MKAYPLAAFDFDGTLCPGDSILPFLQFAVKQGIAPPVQYLWAGFGYISQMLFPRRLVRAKEHTLSFIKGRRMEELDSFCADFVKLHLVPRLYKDGIDEIRRLKKDSYTVVIVSASPNIYMKHLLNYIPADAVIATECEAVDHIYTGHIHANCKGVEKVKRIREFLNLSPEESFSIAKAFGGSKHAIPMLSIAQKGYLINAPQQLIKSYPDFALMQWR